ncbi:MAG TPA: dirigent protein [Phototrophicaceae bacterium]|nr:dirigent protein [Phototrophicaceae bacterium]
MRTSTATTVVAGLGALALAGTAFAAGAAGHDRHARGRTLEFDTQLSDFFFQDFGPDGVREVTSVQDPLLSPSRGDRNVFEDVLLRHGREVGSGSGSCIVTDVDLEAGVFTLQCDLTYELPGGQLAVQGRTSNAPEKTLAVVGGTGRYVGASGEVTFTELGDGTGTLVIRLER